MSALRTAASNVGVESAVIDVFELAAWAFWDSYKNTKLMPWLGPMSPTLATFVRVIALMEGIAGPQPAAQPVVPVPTAKVTP